MSSSGILFDASKGLMQRSDTMNTSASLCSLRRTRSASTSVMSVMAPLPRALDPTSQAFPTTPGAVDATDYQNFKSCNFSWVCSETGFHLATLLYAERGLGRYVAIPMIWARIHKGNRYLYPAGPFDEPEQSFFYSA